MAPAGARQTGRSCWVGMLLSALGLEAKQHPLRLDEIHFIVMSSDQVLERALYANHTWCSYSQARCTFATPRRICSREFGGCLKTMLVSGRSPNNCCAQREFFCKAHRAETLDAQYRFLPALLEYRKRNEFAHAKWIVLVDDDAFVFVENLRRHLENYPSHVPLYMGEFLDGPNWSFVCGGGGSVLSRAAMERMDLHGCIKRNHKKCMQSDWMIAECAHHHYVRYVKGHGCDSCSHITKRKAHDIIHTKLPSCHFMQQSSLFLPYMEPATKGVPSIIHGYRSESDYRQLMEWFRHTDRTNGSWTYAQHSGRGPAPDRQKVNWRPRASPSKGGDGGGAGQAGDASRAGPSAAAPGEPSGEQDGAGGVAGESDPDKEGDGPDTLHNTNARDQDAELAARKPY